MANPIANEQTLRRQWWGRRRLRYNAGLLAAGALAFGCHIAVILWGLSIGADPDSPPVSACQMARGWLPLAAGAMVILLAVANLGYCLGPLLERLIPVGLVSAYRRTAFALGFWASALVPFVVPGLFACFFLLCLLAGYGSPVSASDLPGTYLADYGLARDTVVLAPDGQFTQTVKVRKSGNLAAARGTWSYDPAYKEITFSQEFLSPVLGWEGEVELEPDFDHPQDRTPTTLEVRWLVGKLEFGGDSLPWGRVGGAIPHTKQPK